MRGVWVPAQVAEGPLPGG